MKHDYESKFYKKINDSLNNCKMTFEYIGCHRPNLDVIHLKGWLIVSRLLLSIQHFLPDKAYFVYARQHYLTFLPSAPMYL